MRFSVTPHQGQGLGTTIQISSVREHFRNYKDNACNHARNKNLFQDDTFL